MTLVAGGICSIRTPKPTTARDWRTNRKPIDTTSPPKGLSLMGRNSTRSIAIPTRPTKTRPTTTATKNGN